MVKFDAAGAVSRRVLILAAAAVTLAGTVAYAQDNGFGTPDQPVEVRMIANEAFASI